MEPLAEAHLRGVERELLERGFGRAVLAEQPHVEVAVVRRALGLPVAGGCGPLLRQIVEAVPVDARGPADQHFGGSLDAEFLDLLGPEARDADLRDPDGLAAGPLDLAQLLRPLVYGPVVPIQREAVDREDV